MSDGLVDAAAIPQIHPEKATEAATGLRQMGIGVKTKVTTLNTDWKKLPAHYEAPEQQAVYTLQDPAQRSAEDLASTLDKAAGYLDEFAGQLAGLKQRFADLTADINAFRGRVSGGVERSCGFFGLQTETVPWYDDSSTLGENGHLIGRVNELVAELSQAETACASKIRALVQHRNSCPAPFTTVSKDQLNAQKDLPWGYAREYEPKNCGESVGYGARDVVTGIGTGVGSLILGYDNHTGEYFQGDVYGQTWGGMGNLAGSLVVVSAGSAFLSPALRAAGVNNGFTQFLDDRNLVVASAVTGLVNVDITAEDPLHKWKEDGWRAGTSAVLNVATFFIPGAGAVGGGLKAGSAGARLAKLTAATADMAVPGGSYLVKGLTSLMRVDGAGSLIDDAARAALKPSAPGLAAGASDVVGAGSRPPLDPPAARPPSVEDVGTRSGRPHTPVPPVRPDGSPVTPLEAPATPRPSAASTPEQARPPEPVRTPDPARTPEPVRRSDPARLGEPSGVPEPAGVGARSTAAHTTLDSPGTSRGSNTTEPAHSPSPGHVDPAPPNPRPASHDGPPTSGDHDPSPGSNPDHASPATGDGGHRGEHLGSTDGPAPAPDSLEPRTSDAAGDGPRQPDVVVDDRGRRVPVDVDGHAIQVHGRNVFYGADDLLHYEGSGHMVRYADYPDGIDAPTTPDLDHIAQRDALVPVEATPGYGEGAAQAYATATAHHTSDLAEVNRLLDELSLHRSDVGGSQSLIMKDLRTSAIQSGDVDRARLIRQLADAVDAESLSRAQRYTTAESSGMYASLDDFARNDVTPVLGHAEGDLRPGRSRLDTMGVREIDGGWQVILDEAKGRGDQGSATLGAATVSDGSRAQQGTSAYLVHQLHHDPRVIERLAAYADGHPGFAAAWNRGEVTIDYRLVVASPDGRVRIAHFVVDRSVLTLPPIPR